jgi:DNA-binding response OmpR family regulator
MVMGRVFIVDDDAHVRKTVGLVLTQGGYEVLEAVDGEDAIAAIQSYPPGFSVHAIICDIDLPKVNGHDLIAFIRAKLPSVPVIVLTSSREDVDLVRAYQLGANSYIRKAVDFKEFLEATRLIGRYWLTLNELPSPRAVAASTAR